MAKSRRPRHSLEVRRFQRAALQRWEEAIFLLERGNYSTAAVYLAGYAIECGLKALVLSREPVSRHSATLQSFRGRKAHDFEWLIKELRERRVVIPAGPLDDLARLTGWTTDLRYEPKEIPMKAAQEFLASSEEVLRWIQRSL